MTNRQLQPGKWTLIIAAVVITTIQFFRPVHLPAAVPESKHVGGFPGAHKEDEGQFVFDFDEVNISPERPEAPSSLKVGEHVVFLDFASLRVDPVSEASQYIRTRKIGDNAPLDAPHKGINETEMSARFQFVLSRDDLELVGVQGISSLSTTETHEKIILDGQPIEDHHLRCGIEFELIIGAVKAEADFHARAMLRVRGIQRWHSGDLQGQASRFTKEELEASKWARDEEAADAAQEASKIPDDLQLNADRGTDPFTHAIGWKAADVDNSVVIEHTSWCARVIDLPPAITVRLRRIIRGRDDGPHMSICVAHGILFPEPRR